MVGCSLSPDTYLYEGKMGLPDVSPTIGNSVKLGTEDRKRSGWD
jgi:hypothetical protein